jgi:hypothetical protein
MIWGYMSLSGGSGWFISAKLLSSDNGVLNLYHLCSIADVQIPMIKCEVIGYA